MSDLWADSTEIILQARIINTLVHNSIGAGKPEMAGVYLQVSYFVSFIYMIPVIILWFFTGPLLVSMGFDALLSSKAHYYSMVLSTALPARLIFR